MKYPFLALLLLLLFSGCETGITTQETDPSTNSILNSPGWQTILPGGETICSDGSPYRFHVKPGEQNKLFVFLNGGGACWNSQTCDEQAGTNTFNPRADMPINDPRTQKGIFDLENPDNPVADWSMLFIPYCTGDVHLGSATRTYLADAGYEFNINHQGAKNAASVLNWAVENLRPDKIVVAGSSAGAVASPVYAGKVAQLYPAAELLQFADGAAGYRSQTIPSIMAQWNVTAALPEGQYPDLNMSEASFYDFYDLRQNPTASTIRHALFDTVNDQVQIGFRNLTGDTGTLSEAIRTTYPEIENYSIHVSHYLAPGDYHTILTFDRFYQERVGNISFLEWFTSFIEEHNPDSVDCMDIVAEC